MSITYYTIKGKTDGFGAQYQAILSGIAYCNYKNYIYIHSPITKMEHNVDINKANEFMGINESSYQINSICEIQQKHYEPEVHWCIKPSMYYNDKVLEYIRKCYYNSKKPYIGLIDVAIHIRRGDVNNENNNERYTDNIYYKEIIKQIKIKYPTYTITVFSEGKYSDFDNLGLEENCFKLNTDVFETFHSLVCSKVLIQSISSFSYCAGIINQNTVYHYDSFWHKKLDHWLSLSSLIQ
jgi:hypothetical protein